MSQIEVDFAEVVQDVFLGGCNLNKKLDTKKRTGLKLLYDRKAKELAVFWNGCSCLISSGLVTVSVTPAEAGFMNPMPEVKAIETVKTIGSAPMTKKAPFTAQVETPHGLTRSKL